MSKDFPNRKDWLALRNKRPSAGRFVHVSGIGRAARRLLPAAIAITTSPGVTYNVGRNAMKRAKAARVRALVS
jgi:hypothetical protein